MDTPARSVGSSSVTGADQQLCGICFCEVHAVDNPRGTLNTCDHLFCFYCISTWAKDTNVCPHCKARFNRIVMVDGTSGEETVIKVRKKNYKGWEDVSDDEERDDSAGSDSGVTPRHLVLCALCGSGGNAARLICCDRHLCTFVAHLDCLGLVEAPTTFVCSRCSGGATSPCTPTPSTIDDENRLAAELEREVRTEARRRSETVSPDVHARAEVGNDAVVRAGVASPSAAAPELVSRPTTTTTTQRNAPSTAAAVVLLSSATSHGDSSADGVPYYLKGANTAQAEIARQQLASRLEASAHHRQAREEHLRNQKRLRNIERDEGSASKTSAVTTPALPVEAAGRSSAVVSPFAAAASSLDAMERDLLRAYFRDQLAVVRRQHFVESAKLRLVGNGDIAVSPPPSRLEEIHREETLRVEALRVAKEMVARRMQPLRAAQHARVLEEIRRKALREAQALAKLSEIIATHRRRALEAARQKKREQAADHMLPVAFSTAGRPPRHLGQEDAKAVSTGTTSSDAALSSEPKVKTEPRWN